MKVIDLPFLGHISDHQEVPLLSCHQDTPPKFSLFSSPKEAYNITLNHNFKLLFTFIFWHLDNLYLSD